VLFDGHCKVEDVEKAFHIYNRVRGNKLFPNVNSYFDWIKSTSIETNVFTCGALNIALYNVDR
jgi:pentatricopeptide repeat protein